MSSTHIDADRLLQSARDARARGLSGEELRLLDTAVEAAPDNSRVLNARGMRALADNDHDRAIDAFERATAADPGEPALWLNLATVHRAKGDDEGERKALRAALDIDQLQMTAQVRMAELLGRQGKLSEAAKHWSAVVQLGQATEAPSPGVRDAVASGRAFLENHNAAYASILDAELGEAVTDDAHGRRFRACVDYMLGRRRVYRNECEGIYYPFLPADEFFDRGLFRWFAELEARTPEIRAEALTLLGSASDDIKPYVRLDRGTPENKWSTLDGSLDWSACFLWEYGVRNELVCDRCPATAAAIEAVPQKRIPGKAPTAFFSILKPGAYIPPHTGVSNTRAIVHLPLVVPAHCGFRVGGETREWVEGQAFAFDDTIEHEAWNKSDQPRIVLILDVWNPHLSADEQAWLSKLYSVADRGISAPGH